MKLYHYALIFVAFAIVMVTITDLKVSESSYMAEGTEQQNTIFDRAVVAATGRLLDSENGISELQREEAVEAFYDSLYASFGITDMPLSRENMSLYIPVICVTEPDGFYIYYNDIVYAPSGGTEVQRCWTEKKTYTYRESTAPSGYRATGFIIRFLGNGSCYVYDTKGIINGKRGELFKVYLEDFLEEYNGYSASSGIDPDLLEYGDLIYELKGTMNYWSILTHPEDFKYKEADVRATTLEDNLNYYCNTHNYVAQQSGVLYTFSIPSFDTETYLRATKSTSFLAFFQGYPVPGTDTVFNRYSVSNAEVEMVGTYYIDDTLTYHRREDCPDATVIIDSAGSEYSCAEKGAFACERCYPNTGVHRGGH